MKAIAVFTSGGDAPGMNACIRAVVRSGIQKGIRVYGIRSGYAGMIENDIIEMDSRSVSHIIQKGGTILGSARSKDFYTEEGRKKAAQNLDALNIEGLVAIGGDGTFTGANIFMDEYPVKIVGIPGTIDNDLIGTDYTIGYDTAINTAMEAIDKIKDTAMAHDRCFFVEVMGKDAGYIALRSGIATGAEAILIPETDTDVDALIQTLDENHAKKNTSSIVIVAEGDDAGSAFQIAEKVKARSDEYEIRVTVLGHIQRGGRPTCQDRVLASRLGVAAVDSILNGNSGHMLGIIHNEIAFTPFKSAIKEAEKSTNMLVQLADQLSV